MPQSHNATEAFMLTAGREMGDIHFWEELAKLAPIGTAAVALLALITTVVGVIVALLNLRFQSQTARRRATIDFFFKTEMDENTFKIYNDFRAELPNIAAIVSRPVLKHTDADYIALIKWLNICEMLAMGVRSKAFSDPVAHQYWGYVIPDSYNRTRLFIDRVRRTPNIDAGPKSFWDLQKLSEEWDQRADD
ncbi:MAG TPA: DUF4760 domain-containing protein [Xanthobacteraceae bacterium]|nr:DUF4760 domain-containing protein [Xanthobacteraceae bacterium]